MMTILTTRRYFAVLGTKARGDGAPCALVPQTPITSSKLLQCYGTVDRIEAYKIVCLVPIEIINIGEALEMIFPFILAAAHIASLGDHVIYIKPRDISPRVTLDTVVHTQLCPVSAVMFVCKVLIAAAALVKIGFDLRVGYVLERFAVGVNNMKKALEPREQSLFYVGFLVHYL
jgi:hypothetical protein